jgi:hypothetical protein
MGEISTMKITIVLFLINIKIKAIKPGLYMKLGLINTIYEVRKTLLGIKRGEKSQIWSSSWFSAGSCTAVFARWLDR